MHNINIHGYMCRSQQEFKELLISKIGELEQETLVENNSDNALAMGYLLKRLSARIKIAKS